MNQHRSLVFQGFVVLVSSFFVLANLADYPLWDDEAIAALLGKNILAHGVPHAFDGVNYIAYMPTDVREDHLWKVWGWIPLYLNAAVYWIAGPDTFAARLPYAVIGVCFLLLVYRSLRRRHPESWIPEATTLLCLFSVPLLLHFRQCQYYAPTILLTWLMFLSADEDLSQRRNAGRFVLASFLLFNCHFLAWAASFLFSSLIQGFRLVRERRLAWSRVSAVAWAAVVNVPPALLHEPWELRDEYTGAASDTIDSIRQSFDILHEYVVEPAIPGVVLLALIAAYLPFGRRSLAVAERKHLASALFFFFAYVLFVINVSWGAYRYYVPAIPVLLYGVAILGESLARRSRPVAAVLVAILLLTNVASLRLTPRGIGSWFVRFASEITGSHEDVNEVLIAYLKEHAKAGDTFVTSYGPFPIAYYTGLAIGGGAYGYRTPNTPFPEQAPALTAPDWLIVRKHWDFNKHAFNEILSRNRYRKITLPGVDTKWGNRPDPHTHHFRTPRQGPPIELFERNDRS